MNRNRFVSEMTPSGEKDCFQIVERRGREFNRPLHAHGDYELTFIENGAGIVRVVGDSREKIGAYELVLVGGGEVEHTWEQGDCSSDDVREITLRFSPDLFSESLLARNQFASICQMLSQAKCGLVFPLRTVMKIYSRLDGLVADPKEFSQVVALLEMLHELSMSEDVRRLTTGESCNKPCKGHSRRVNEVKDWVSDNFRSAVSLVEAAEKVGMSPNSFSRFFKARTGKTFSDYLIDIRIGAASSLLVETNRNVIDICAECGFNNLSNFNRLFKKKKGVTPKEFRSRYRKSRVAL